MKNKTQFKYRYRRNSNLFIVTIIVYNFKMFVIITVMSVVIMSIYVSNQLCGNIMSAYILGRGCLYVCARARVCVCVGGLEYPK